MTLPIIYADTHLRLARPSLDLDAAEHFYVQGLGLQVLYQHRSEEALSLLMLGLPGAGWHLELTRDPVHQVHPVPTPEDLLVFYLASQVPQDAVAQLVACGGQRVTALNPYWEEWGVTVQDPDGYRLVLCQRRWTA